MSASSTRRLTASLAALFLATGLAVAGCSGTAAEEPQPSDEASAPSGAPSDAPGPEASATAIAGVPMTEEESEAAAVEVMHRFAAALTRAYVDAHNFDPSLEAAPFAGEGAIMVVDDLRDQVLALEAGVDAQGAVVARDVEITAEDFGGRTSNGMPNMDVTACFDASGITFHWEGQRLEDWQCPPNERHTYVVGYVRTPEPAAWRVMYVEDPGEADISC